LSSHFIIADKCILKVLVCGGKKMSARQHNGCTVRWRVLIGGWKKMSLFHSLIWMSHLSQFY